MHHSNRLMSLIAAIFAALLFLTPGAAVAQDGHEGHDHGHEGHDHEGTPAAPPSSMELRQLTQMAGHPDHAAAAAKQIRTYLTGTQLSPQYRLFLRRLLVRAMIVSEAPPADIVREADALAPDIPQEGGAAAYYYAELAQSFVSRNVMPAKAVEYAEKARDQIAPGSDENIGLIVGGLLGRAYLANGQCKPAIETLDAVVSVHPDSQPILFALGSAHEMCGNDEQAIAFYIRSLGVYLGQSDAADEPLRALYAKEHGSVDGLDERIAAAKKASIQQVVFDSREFVKPAPTWVLQDLDGNTVESKSFDGKIVVLDFWGSWCGPCRYELPHFQEIYEKYRDEGVIFYGINWERVDRSQRVATAKKYMEENGFDFPVVVDLEDRTPFAFGVTSYPTVFLIDPSGNIKYRNVGFNEAIGEILTLQIDSMIAERDGKTSAKN